MAKIDGYKRLLAAIFSFILISAVGISLLASQDSAAEVPRVERLATNPIITRDMLPDNDGENINGPSLIRVPTWVQNPLGKYYLYFAHHVGSYIRLAYADELVGPWQIYQPGTLRLEDTVCNDIHETRWAGYKHVASPDVLIDSQAQEFRMYFHCPAHTSGPRDIEDSYRQVTFVATSKDGINFEAGCEPLGNPYFRVFRWNNAYYALGMPGVFYRSDDGLHGFVEGPKLFTKDMRHSAVKVQGDTLNVFYSVVGENPERILLSRIHLSSNWMKWRETDPVVVLEPKREWEGASLPKTPSARGYALGPVRQLRDPAIFKDEGRTYILYSVAGESGIAIAELHWD
ncbi:hypothetical protein ACFL2O_11445 [Thermodesulfobacteriota bacterium]